MSNEMSIAGAGASPALPTIRMIRSADLKDALAKGFDDFMVKPSHYFFLSVIYPVVIFFLIRFIAGYEIWPLLFLLVAAYTLTGPVIATGLYEMSRRRELGLDVSWRHTFGVLRSPSMRAIAELSAVLTAIFLAWLGAALAIYELTFSNAAPTTIVEFAQQVFTTSSGWTLMIVGCGVGLIFAVMALAIGVVSFPLLLDRDVRVAIAVQTSIGAVLVNPKAMAMWGLIVAGAMVIGCLPFFVGLAVVWPVLGHSSWHLYRKIVEH